MSSHGISARERWLNEWTLFYGKFCIYKCCLTKWSPRSQVVVKWNGNELKSINTWIHRFVILSVSYATKSIYKHSTRPDTNDEIIARKWGIRADMMCPHISAVAEPQLLNRCSARQPTQGEITKASPPRNDNKMISLPCASGDVLATEENKEILVLIKRRHPGKQTGTRAYDTLCRTILFQIRPGDEPTFPRLSQQRIVGSATCGRRISKNRWHL